MPQRSPFSSRQLPALCLSLACGLTLLLIGRSDTTHLASCDGAGAQCPGKEESAAVGSEQLVWTSAHPGLRLSEAGAIAQHAGPDEPLYVTAGGRPMWRNGSTDGRHFAEFTFVKGAHGIVLGLAHPSFEPQSANGAVTWGKPERLVPRLPYNIRQPSKRCQDDNAAIVQNAKMVGLDPPLPENGPTSACAAAAVSMGKSFPPLPTPPHRILATCPPP